MYLLLLRMFRFFRLQPRLAIITRTLQRSGPDLIHFLLIFCVCTFGFSSVAWINFGNRVSSISNLADALFTMFQMTFVDFGTTYTEMLQHDVYHGTFIFAALFTANGGDACQHLPRNRAGRVL